jgi:hypothetical protein
MLLVLSAAVFEADPLTSKTEDSGKSGCRSKPPCTEVEQLCYHKENISMTKDNENITPFKENERKLFAAQLRTLADLVEQDKIISASD